MLVLADTETGKSQTFQTKQELHDWVLGTTEKTPLTQIVTKLKEYLDSFLEKEREDQNASTQSSEQMKSIISSGNKNEIVSLSLDEQKILLETYTSQTTQEELVESDKQHGEEAPKNVDEEMFPKNTNVVPVKSEQAGSIQNELPLLSEITRKNPNAFFHPFQPTDQQLRSPPLTQWDNRHIFNVSSRVIVPNPSIQNMDEERAKEFYNNQSLTTPKEIDIESVVTEDNEEEKIEPFCYFQRKELVHLENTVKIRQDLYDLSIWFQEKVCLQKHLTNLNPHEFNNLQNCWKLFLLNPDLCAKDILREVPFQYQYLFKDIQKEMIVVNMIKTPTMYPIDFSKYFLFYKQFSDKLPNFFELRTIEIRQTLFQTLAGYLIDKKVYPGVVRDLVKIFCESTVYRKTDSHIQSSEMYSKWIDFLKNIFECDENVWACIQASTNTRQFSRDMKYHGYTTRRRSIGILYNGVTFEANDNYLQRNVVEFNSIDCTYETVN